MKKRKKSVFFVLALLFIFVCSTACNNVEVEELKKQVAELKQQVETKQEETLKEIVTTLAIYEETEFDDNVLGKASDKNNLSNDLSNASGKELHNMGRMYFFGDGVEKNYELAKQCYEMAAEKGYTDSLNNLALMILDGNISGTKEQARQYLETAGVNGFAGAYYNLGRQIFLNVLEGTRGESFFYFEKAAEMGDEEAKNVIENFFDKIASLDYNSMSVDELLDTGYDYYWGGFTTIAIKCWETAASKGSVEALRNLGDLYQNYDTVTLKQLIDVEKSKQYYIQAATLGDEKSKEHLRNGFGVYF